MKQTSFHRFVALWLVICLTWTAVEPSWAHSAERKKVALVLSGGGAKGAAHVRAIKVIEEAGIPIDYIVGTSIGALVGGMYASGYNAEQMDSIVTHQDWKVLLTDATKRRSLNLRQRQSMDNYMLTVRFDKSPYEVVEGGLFKGINIARLFTQVTADTPDSIDFHKLHIPFACVATDLVTGEEVDMHAGILAESMRASMAIPGVFPPVHKGGKVLADGGMTNNYPVDVALRMGADYIIGVDLGEEATPAEKLNTPQAVAMQVVNMLTSQKHEENVEKTDVYIKVDVTGYSAASFNTEAIDTLLVRGEKAARDKWDELVALRHKLGLSQPAPIPPKRAMPKNMYTVRPVSSIYKPYFSNSFLGVGARFDNEELASLLVGGLYEFNHRNKLSVGLEGRLGRRYGALLYGSVNMSRGWNTQLSYQVMHNDLSIYSDGTKAMNTVYTQQRVQLDFSHSWRNLRGWIGGELSYTHFNDILVHKEFDKWMKDNKNETTISYFARLTFDNRDASINASRGLTWSVGYRFVTTNGAKFDGKQGLHIVDARASLAIPLTASTIVTPYVSGRWLPVRNTFFTTTNLIGGINADGRYVAHQLSFAGIDYLQPVNNNLFIAGTSVRQFLGKNNYLSGVANYGQASDGFFQGDTRHMYGAAIGYGYRTPVGPIELHLNWSNVTEKVGVFVNLGYMF